MTNKIIHAHIYEPHRPSIFGKSPANARAELHLYTCEHSEECDAFAKGQCINVGNVFGSRCPHGRKQVTDGFTKKAAGYYKQIANWKEMHKDAYNALSQAPSRVTKVYGGWMLPYSFMDMNESVPFKAHGGAFRTGCAFIESEQLNKSTLEKIVAYRPLSMVGGEITDYQQKIVPKFLFDLKTNYPEQYVSAFGENQAVNQRIESISFIGRTALLKTIAPNCKLKLGTKEWLWDGKKISMQNAEFMLFEPCKWTANYAEFAPCDSATVKITSNEQVNESTVFVD